jgi:hypothetical protein
MQIIASESLGIDCCLNFLLRFSNFALLNIPEKKNTLTVVGFGAQTPNFIFGDFCMCIAWLQIEHSPNPCVLQRVGHRPMSKSWELVSLGLQISQNVTSLSSFRHNRLV